MLDSVKGASEIGSGSGQSSIGADEGRQQFRAQTQSQESAIDVNTGDDARKLVEDEPHGIELETVEFGGIRATFQSAGDGEMAFELLLGLEPFGVTAIFPVGEIGGRYSGKAPGAKTARDFHV